MSNKPKTPRNDFNALDWSSPVGRGWFAAHIGLSLILLSFIPNSVIQNELPLLIFILPLVSFAVFISGCMRRLVDAGISRAWFILMTIPVVIPFFIGFLLLKGSKNVLQNPS